MILNILTVKTALGAAVRDGLYSDTYLISFFFNQRLCRWQQGHSASGSPIEFCQGGIIDNSTPPPVSSATTSANAAHTGRCSPSIFSHLVGIGGPPPLLSYAGAVADSHEPSLDECMPQLLSCLNVQWATSPNLSFKLVNEWVGFAFMSID